LPAELTYEEVGATRDPDAHPRDGVTLVERALLGEESVFERAATFVMSFGMQRCAGFEVTSDHPVAREGTEVTLRARFGLVRMLRRRASST
jgi:uncharacterized protein (UPF0548 family)